MQIFAKGLKPVIAIIKKVAMSYARNKSQHGPRYNRSRNFNNEEGGSRGRHPSHLKGKDIGLFYAKKNKMKKENEQRDPKPVSKL